MIIDDTMKYLDELEKEYNYNLQLLPYDVMGRRTPIIIGKRKLYIKATPGRLRLYKELDSEDENALIDSSESMCAFYKMVFDYRKTMN